MKRTLYVCRCESIEHMLVVTADEEDLFLEVHLAPLPLHKRLLGALRYLLGRRSPWGDFEEIVLSPASALDLGDQMVSWASGDGEVFRPNDVF